jgi:molybdate transport system regulatory protein
VDVFGEGRVRLFEAVKRLGSLHKAAAELGMSYRAAWGKVKKAEERLGFKLLEPRESGMGRGSRLTANAQELLKRFDRFITRAHRKAEQEFRAAFGRK